MDFASEFFWVLMLVLYLVFQVIGARKKNRQIEQKRRKSSEPPEPVGATREREPELDEALQEIRRALGFPDRQREAPRPIPPSREEQRPEEAPVPVPPAARAPTTTGEPHPATRTPSVPPSRPPVSQPQVQSKATPVPSKPSRVPSPRREPRLEQIPSPTRMESGGGIYSSAEKKAFRSKYGLSEIDRPLPRADSETKREAQPALAASRIVRRLKEASAAREAFLLKEILDRPRSERPLR